MEPHATGKELIMDFSADILVNVVQGRGYLSPKEARVIWVSIAAS